MSALPRILGTHEQLARSLRVCAVSGLIAAFVVLGLGRALIAWRLGDDRAVLAQLEDDVRREFRRSAGRLERAAVTLAQASELATIEHSQTASRRLFEIVKRAARASDIPDPAITVFDQDGHAVAWHGRPSELPAGRVDGGRALFVAQGSLGLRLIAVEPVVSRRAGPGGSAPTTSSRPVGAVAAEQRLSEAGGGTVADTYTVNTWLGYVTLHRTFADRRGEGEPARFVLHAPSGEALLEARVQTDAPERARLRWRARVDGVALCVLAAAALLMAAGFALARGPAIPPWSRAAWTAGAIALLVIARALLWYAVPPDSTSTETVRSSIVYASVLLRDLHRSPVDFLLSSLVLTAAVVLLVEPVRAFVLARRGARRTFPSGVGNSIVSVGTQLLAGTVVVALELGVLALVSDTAENASVNLLRLAVQPWEPPRFALLIALILVQAAAVWVSVLVCRLALGLWRFHAGSRARWLIPLAWAAPSMAVALVGAAWYGLPGLPIAANGIAVAFTAYLTRRGIPWYRHGSQASRIGWLLLSLLVPAWLCYPALVHYVDRAKRQLVEEQYARQVRNHPEELYAHLTEALAQIDRFPGLVELVQSLTDAGRPSTEAAFALWRQTDLEQFRLTSAVELYSADGALVSRFGLNFPESEALPLQYRSRSCRWDVFGLAVPFGADERRMLNAERGICATAPNGASRVVGAVMVHIMLDYSALPFISSQSPYYEFIRASRAGRREGTAAGDVELTIYGWSRLPIYSSSGRTWQLRDDVFERAYRSRESFWTILRRGEAGNHVLISNDRNGLYALGYPVLTVFNHLVQLAEITTLAALTFIALVVLLSIARRVLRHGPYPAQLLVREVRASFYRKLFLSFVAAAVLPVVALAFLIHTYFTNQLQNDVEAEAARTASVARRVIEESVAVQQREVTTTASGLTDEAMVWISRVIDQDVNIFEGPQLLVTSERDLFASGLLSTRTPHDVYQAVGIERLPNYVGQDRIGEFAYLVAATPVRVGNRDGILTVPLASRQREIEREIDELDRGVHLGALVLILLGAALGYAMAERIGDPVQRLTRATRRIAAGDLNVRVIVRTADELQRLVEAFNRMAGELQRQRRQLERSNRLEAWAEMARQVAHDIKNPLTPIQLSAEHLRRVHQDRGEPLGAVLDNCVDTILAQVRLLRQIAAEFSSFGSSPTARPTATAVADLIKEVVDPYRLGVDGRVSFDIRVDPGLPPLSIDRTLIGRAITNVLENALHAMPSGGTLAISARGEESAVEIAVADTGVGMDEESAARIFEPYFSTKATGTGLGLSIARRNVELHGGSIAVVSRKGVGTTVTIRLPVQAAA